MDDDQVFEARLVESDRDASVGQPIAPENPSPESGQASQLLQQKWAVLLVLFTVTGFLGIPLLWMNKRFSEFERIAWAVVVTGYTTALIWVAVKICLWSWARITGAA